MAFQSERNGKSKVWTYCRDFMQKYTHSGKSKPCQYEVIMSNAEFTLNGFDELERNLKFVKTDL